MFIKIKGDLINLNNVLNIRRINDCVVIYFNDGMHHDIECKSKSEAKRFICQISGQLTEISELM